MATTDYKRFFDTEAYLTEFYKDPGNYPITSFALERYDNFWKEIQEIKPKILEYGGGPSIHSLISACKHVKCIVFAEYTESNREAVQAWKGKGSGAFDWRPAFQYVVRDLEGNAEDKVIKREEELRNKIRHIVSCDLRASEIVELSKLPNGDGPPFDVISSSLCLESTVATAQEYKEAIASFAKLLVPGGILLLYGVFGETEYIVGDVKFRSFCNSEELVFESFHEAGLTVTEFSQFREMRKEDFNKDGCPDSFFIAGKLKSE